MLSKDRGIGTIIFYAIVSCLYFCVFIIFVSNDRKKCKSDDRKHRIMYGLRTYFSHKCCSSLAVPSFEGYNYFDNYTYTHVNLHTW